MSMRWEWNGIWPSSMHWNVKNHYSRHGRKHDNKEKKTNGINYEVWWRMMLGQKNNEEGEPISLWLMKIPNKTYVHQRAPIPV